MICHEYLHLLNQRRLFHHPGPDQCQGRNRRCITVDLHNERGRDIVRRLAERSDVLIENFRPGVMEKWGLGPKVGYS